MIAVTIDSRDPRGLRAVQLAAGAGQWLKVRAVDGRKAYGVESERHRGVYHLATCQACTCVDFQRRQQPCKHVLAVRLHVTLVTAATSAQRKRNGRGREQVDAASAARLTRDSRPEKGVALAIDDQAAAATAERGGNGDGQGDDDALTVYRNHAQEGTDAPKFYGQNPACS
jgi:hypothetical protein